MFNEFNRYYNLETSPAANVASPNICDRLNHQHSIVALVCTYSSNLFTATEPTIWPITAATVVECQSLAGEFSPSRARLAADE